MHTWLISKSISERQDLEIAVHVYHFMSLSHRSERGESNNDHFLYIVVL